MPSLPNAPDAAVLAPGRAASLPAAAAALGARLAFREALDLARGCNASLPQVDADLRALRTRGYPFRTDLEAALGQAQQRASGAVSAAQAAVSAAAHALGARVAAFQEQVHAACTGDPRTHADALARLVEEQRALEEALRDADRQVEAAAAALTAPVQAITAAIKNLAWGLDQLAEATLPLEPGERPVAVIAATWADPPDRLDKQGLLLLTDRRLRFEQKEVFVTDRMKGGLASSQEAVHQLVLHEPWANLAAVADHTSGLLVKTQAVLLRFGPAAKAPPSATLNLTLTALANPKGSEVAALLSALRAGHGPGDLAIG